MNALATRIVANELVPVYATDAGERVVDARELHKFLQVETRFNDWIERRIQKYAFVSGQDFYSVLSKTSEGGRPSAEYVLRIDVAKELCMVESNEQGSKARKYFIDVEKRFRMMTDVSKLSPEMQMFHKMFQAVAKTEIQLAEATKRIDEVQEHVATIQSMLLQRDKDWRKSINSLMAGASYRSGTDYRTLRTESYQLLEERGHCDLAARLRNLKQRLEDHGATKTQVADANRMDVIENDARLKEIYTAIVKELSIGTLKVR